MSELAFIVPVRNIETLHRTLSMLSFQRDRAFRVYVVDLTGSESAVSSVTEEFEEKLSLSVYGMDLSGEPLWKNCLDLVPDAQWVCFLMPGVNLGRKSFGRMRKCIQAHPDFDAFRWILAKPYRKPCLKTSAGKLFKSVFSDGGAAPLSSFFFRAQTLRDAFAADPEAAGMDFAVILSGAKKTGARTVRWERVGYRKPKAPSDPSQIEKSVRARLAFFRWTERFFGDDYPLGVGARLGLFAGELARLYPSYTQDELKEELYSFSAADGTVRRMRAASAIKSAIKARQDALTAVPPEK